MRLRWYELAQNGIDWCYRRGFFVFTRERRMFTSFDIFFAKLEGTTLILVLHDGTWLELARPTPALRDLLLGEPTSRTACARGCPSATRGRVR